MTKFTVVLLVYICHCTIANAQNIDALIKDRKEWFQASGNMNLTQIFNHAQGGYASRKNYTYIFNANIDLKLLGFIDAPFRVMYSNLGNQFTQPTFNQTSIHPKYKWIQLHLGTIAVNYNPHTMGGLVFNGAAADLSPGKFSIGFFAGKFKKAVQPSGLTDNDVEAAYSRKGYGGKIGFRSSKSSVHFHYLYATDDPQSIQYNGFSDIKPQLNHAGGIELKQQLNRYFSVHFQHNISYLIQDLRTKENPISGNPAAARYQSTKAGLQLQIKKIQAAFIYEKTDPGYKSLGAYYFNNDLENITTQLSGKLFKNKINWSARGGIQRNNLDGTRMNQMLRYVYSGQLQIQLKNASSGSFSYSNFSSYSNARTYAETIFQNNPYLAWDTLNFRQVSQNITGNFNLSLKQTKKSKHNLTCNGIWQQSAESRNGATGWNDFYNVAIGYNYQNSNGLMIMFATNASRSSLGNQTFQTAGPMLFVAKPFLKNTLKWNATAAYSGGQMPATVMRSSLRYAISKTHNLNLTAQWMQRKQSHEATFTIVYSAALGT